MRRKIAGVYNNSILKFFRNFHTAFHNDCTNLQSHQHCVGSLLSTPLSKTLLIFFNSSCTNGCNVISDSNSSLHFPGDYWYWVPFHIPVGHFMFLLEKCLWGPSLFFISLFSCYWIPRVSFFKINFGC
jgi:hypothetical protein